MKDKPQEKEKVFDRLISKSALLNILEDLYNVKAELVQIFDVAGGGMLVIDKNSSVLRVSKAFINLLGRSEDETRGKKCYEVFPCVQCHTPNCPLTRIFNGEEQVEYEVEKEHKDGTKIHCIISATPLREVNGELIGIVEHFTDITWRKKAEEDLEKAYTKLKETQDQLIQVEKLNAVGQLASGVAHEVRNPLGIIIQGINYLEKRISLKKEDIFETFTMVKDSVKRADRIINLLLDFSKVTNLDLQSEDINSVLENSLSLVRTKSKSKDVDIIIETNKDVPKVRIDKNRIEQVFVNVFLNAIQAMAKGGKIIIRSYDTLLKEARDGVGRRKVDFFRIGEKAVVVEIEDTGVGISEENLKKIFDPFFTTKGPSEGTGLGLSVSRNIIIMHRGLIEVKSKLGKGTKVIIVLKIAGER